MKRVPPHHLFKNFFGKQIKEEENGKAFSFQRSLNGNDFVILNIAEDWEERINYKVHNTIHIFSIIMQVYTDILR